MTAREKKFLCLSTVIAAVLCVPGAAFAMHIMEGYLPPAYCVAWGALCLPFLAAGVISIRRLTRERRKSLLLLAMAGAFVFVISSLKIPSVTGSCSHMTGTGLGAILFGVPATSVLGVIVLVFQALLLAHGGLTTLGANAFSMAIAGPLLTWALYRAGLRLRGPELAGVFVWCGWDHIDNSTLMLLRLIDMFNVNSINIAGFDGYRFGCKNEKNYASSDLELSNVRDNPKELNKEIESMLKDYRETRKGNAEITFITDSRFAKIFQKDRV